jgi:hypothetical protein
MKIDKNVVDYAALVFALALLQAVKYMHYASKAPAQSDKEKCGYRFFQTIKMMVACPAVASEKRWHRMYALEPERSPARCTPARRRKISIAA